MKENTILCYRWDTDDQKNYWQGTADERTFAHLVGIRVKEDWFKWGDSDPPHRQKVIALLADGDTIIKASKDRDWEMDDVCSDFIRDAFYKKDSTGKIIEDTAGNLTPKGRNDDGGLTRYLEDNRQNFKEKIVKASTGGKGSKVDSLCNNKKCPAWRPGTEHEVNDLKKNINMEKMSADAQARAKGLKDHNVDQNKKKGWRDIATYAKFLNNGLEEKRTVPLEFCPHSPAPTWAPARMAINRDDSSSTCPCQCRNKFRSVSCSRRFVHAESTAMKVQSSMRDVKSWKGLDTKNIFRRTKKMMSALSSVFAVLEPVMFLMEVVEMFLPPEDSPELAYMKVQFGVVNGKLESLLQGQDEIKAAIKLLQQTKDIDVGKINTLFNDMTALKPKYFADLRSEGRLQVETELEVEEYQKHASELRFFLNDLLWALTDPQKVSLGIQDNILKLKLKEEKYDCRVVFSLGNQALDLLRKGRRVYLFYLRTRAHQGTASPLKLTNHTQWEEDMHRAIGVIYSEAHSCLSSGGADRHGKESLKNELIMKSAGEAKEILDTRHFAHDWSVVKLEEEKEMAPENHAIHPNTRPTYWIDHTQENSKAKMVAMFRPHSRYVQGDPCRW